MRGAHLGHVQVRARAVHVVHVSDRRFLAFPLVARVHVHLTVIHARHLLRARTLCLLLGANGLNRRRIVTGHRRQQNGNHENRSHHHRGVG